MKITQIDVLEAQMVEFDGRDRYLRKVIPSGLVSWYIPTVTEHDDFSFVLVGERENQRLEKLWQEQRVH